MANNSDKQGRALLIGSCMEINAGNPFSQLRDLFHLKTYYDCHGINCHIVARKGVIRFV